MLTPQTDLRSFDLNLRTETYQYRTPMKFGGRVVTDVTVVTADCDVETGSSSARGFGSMTMGVAWAWPDPTVDDAQKLSIVLELSRRIAECYAASGATGHPLEICHRLAPERDRIAAEVSRERDLAEQVPALAVLLAGSPIEAALFDAHGKAAGKSSYQLLSPEHLPYDLSRYLDESYRGIHLSQLISAQPAASMPLYHLVGALDPLTQADVTEPANDGLPETLGDWIHRDGLTHLKIKLAGDDLHWDVQRVAGVYDVAVEARPELESEWSFSLDFNERCRDEDYVLEMLERLTQTRQPALRCVRYIEQPTHRDLDSDASTPMHRVAERLPVVIDESLVGLRSLRRAVELGYSGIALKACKGHAEALLLGAVARHEKLYLCVQDLTCVGASLLHSASLAAHIPGVAAVESNGRQYCPRGNERWLNDFGDFFEVRDGRVPTGQLDGAGLGYGDDPTLSGPG